jgi:hypothetical protein
MRREPNMNGLFKAVSVAACSYSHRDGSKRVPDEETAQMLALLIVVAVFGALLLDAVIYIVNSIEDDVAGI